jgi:hypothetical protein
VVLARAHERQYLDTGPSSARSPLGTAQPVNPSTCRLVDPRPVGPGPSGAGLSGPPACRPAGLSGPPACRPAGLAASRGCVLAGGPLRSGVASWRRVSWCRGAGSGGALGQVVRSVGPCAPSGRARGQAVRPVRPCAPSGRAGVRPCAPSGRARGQAVRPSRRPSRHFATSHALSYRANVTLWLPTAHFATFGRPATGVNVPLWRDEVTCGDGRPTGQR